MNSPGARCAICKRYAGWLSSPAGLWMLARPRLNFWLVRCAFGLHEFAGRDHNVLSFDAQESIAFELVSAGADARLFPPRARGGSRSW